MNIRRPAAFSVVVAIVLVASVAYPASLAFPYFQSPTTYAIAHESTDGFEETVGQDDVEPGEPVAVATLSRDAQRAFEEAKAQSREQDDGWQRLGSVTVCRGWALICDEYEESPDFPDNVDAYKHYGIVEDDGETYLTYTDGGARLTFGPLVTLLFKLVTFIPYALFLCFAALSRSNVRPTETRAFAGYGLALATVAFLFPYLFMFDLLPLSIYVYWFVVGLTWVVMIKGTARHLRRT